jgi:NAD(P)-dependent dehydrogenase (short-subunit alcohol dehydrogenase family)
MSDHHKRVALVTGANRGIGYAISRRLGKQDITVILGARDPQKGTEACSHLQGEGLDVHFEQLDVIDEKSIKSAIERIQAHFGRLDILINNAGIMIDGEEDALNVDQETVRETLRINVLGPLMLCQYCIPLMQAGGYGRIVNMASGLGSLTEMADPESAYAGVGAPAYRLSKAGLNCITTLMAKEVRADNILINSACPGWVRTDMGGDQAPLTPVQGADTPVWLATLPDGGPTGGVYRERTLIPW